MIETVETVGNMVHWSLYTPLKQGVNERGHLLEECEMCMVVWQRRIPICQNPAHPSCLEVLELRRVGFSSTISGTFLPRSSLPCHFSSTPTHCTGRKTQPLAP